MKERGRARRSGRRRQAGFVGADGSRSPRPTVQGRTDGEGGSAAAAARVAGVLRVTTEAAAARISPARGRNAVDGRVLIDGNDSFTVDCVSATYL